MIDHQRINQNVETANAIRKEVWELMDEYIKTTYWSKFEVDPIEFLQQIEGRLIIFDGKQQPCPAWLIYAALVQFIAAQNGVDWEEGS